MKYLVAIIHTILLVLIPLVSMPALQWYKRTFCEPDTDLFFVYGIFFIITFGSLFLTLIRWICAVTDKDIKDL
jgi:hypothetical protein